MVDDEKIQEGVVKLSYILAEVRGYKFHGELLRYNGKLGGKIREIRKRIIQELYKQSKAQVVILESRPLLESNNSFTGLR